ncbi:MAG TPA: hypothetical protein EYG21_07575, partial [Nitrospinaceae bacterium]|nr:hypothetical protein [Nitrospinaceae bacterium]
MKTIAFTFGRFQPPTTGHKKLFDKVRKTEKYYRIFSSKTQDSKKNPLKHEDKVNFMKAMFPLHVQNFTTVQVTIPHDILVYLYKEKFTDVSMVVGSDRVDEFEKILIAYNGKKAKHGYYKFNSINIVSAGERDPDSDGVKGMSGTKMRKAAQDNDYKSFSKGLPPKFKHGKLLFKKVQEEMGVKTIKEWLGEARVPLKPGHKFIDSRENGNTNKKYTIHRMGSRMTDPCLVYIDGEEWKEFSGKAVAKKAAQKECAKEEFDLEERNYELERANYHSQPEQMARNAGRSKARRQMIKAGKAARGDKMDVHHKDNDPINNDPANLAMATIKWNRTEPRLRKEAKNFRKVDKRPNHAAKALGDPINRAKTEIDKKKKKKKGYQKHKGRAWEETEYQTESFKDMIFR